MPSTNTKFHYQFNLRDLANVFQGICLSQTEYYRKPQVFIRLWYHECCRVMEDRLIDMDDVNRFGEMIHR